MQIFKVMRNWIILIAILFLSLRSCSEFLVVEPDSQVSITEQFSTVEKVHQAVNGMYYSFEKLLAGKFYIYADLVGGNFAFAPSKTDYIIEVPPGRYIEQVYEFRDLEKDSDYAAFYANAYSVINEANLVIEQVTDHPLFTVEQVDQIKAEALACRAYVHYLIAIMYAQNYNYTSDASHPGIVYNTATVTAGEDYPERLTMAETWRLMQEDMQTALSMFGPDQALPYGPSHSYFNRLTTAAVYARMALQMNDWETAYWMADSVIVHSGVTLMEGDDYVVEWEKEEAPVSEIIFELSAPRTSDDGSVTFSVANAYFGYVDTENYKEFTASGDLLELYDSVDVRSRMFMEILLPTAVNEEVSDQPYYFTRKFQDDPGIPMIRLSEMYLVRAEAGTRMGGTEAAGALSDLNTIRERAGLAPAGADADLLEEIFLERRRELAFESILFYDIARYQKDIERDKGCISAVCNLSYPSDYYVLPIPESSVSLNENMIQNEGY